MSQQKVYFSKYYLKAKLKCVTFVCVFLLWCVWEVNLCHVSPWLIPFDLSSPPATWAVTPSIAIASCSGWSAGSRRTACESVGRTPCCATTLLTCATSPSSTSACSPAVRKPLDAHDENDNHKKVPCLESCPFRFMLAIIELVEGLPGPNMKYTTVQKFGVT